MADRRSVSGRQAENLAAAHLTAAGLRIVARNWRQPEGELDIVADDAGTCVFVEVRSRTGADHGHALEAITPHKRAQVIRTARRYLDANQYVGPAPVDGGFHDRSRSNLARPLRRRKLGSDHAGRER